MANPRISVFSAHIAGWLLFFSLPLAFMYSQHEQNNLGSILITPAYWLFCLSFLSLFYLVNDILAPKLFLQRKYFAFFAVILVLFAAFYLLKPFDKLMSSNRPGTEPREMRPPPQFSERPPAMTPMGPPPQQDNLFSFDIMSVFLFIMIVALAMAIQINKQLYLTQKKALQAETDKAEAELSFLKAQINPHFLFNTLNNLYVLALNRNPHTAESIMRLSNIMRYMTDDVRSEYVLLQDELNCIEDYINLQKLRLGQKIPVNFSVSGTVLHQKIAPLILMTFIENAFKYGVSKQKPSAINITITAAEKKIHFHSDNKIFAGDSTLNSTRIGIENTRQRLQHLYPGKHELAIGTKDDLFIVDLAIFT
jgi:two-component system, LytTR family, sensor kinase